MERQSLYFLAPGNVDVRQEQLAPPNPNQVLVRTLVSGISSGTEMLLYHGQFPENMDLDENIDTLASVATYPIKYGYSAIGEIVDRGEAVSQDWIGKRVFSFQPHVSHFVTETNLLQVIPEGLTVEDAVFLPNMETALNFVMDGAPLIGENVVIFGQGIVGLLTTALLAQYPLSSLMTIDRYPLRRQASLNYGADSCLEPSDTKTIEQTIQELQKESYQGADLVYELTGDPKVLNQAVKICGFSGRIVIGSWYGKKQAALDLGGWFHRSRIKMISSQVSSINPEFSGRWDKSRRFQVAWENLKRVKPARLITHRFPIQKAGEAYQLLDENPEDTIQVVFTY
jgi:2-desacetyl-2-hydroxyethyl bacteriochlorophyllide A dehydrogenase